MSDQKPKVQQAQKVQKYDVDGNPFVYGDRMSKRQWFSHGGPGWDFRYSQPEYNWRTNQVENDDPYNPYEPEEELDNND
jgi:hypothetical protein